jgi:hypothetical protein
MVFITGNALLKTYVALAGITIKTVVVPLAGQRAYTIDTNAIITTRCGVAGGSTNTSDAGHADTISIGFTLRNTSAEKTRRAIDTGRIILAFYRTNRQFRADFIAADRPSSQYLHVRTLAFCSALSDTNTIHARESRRTITITGASVSAITMITLIERNVTSIVVCALAITASQQYQNQSDSYQQKNPQ